MSLNDYESGFERNPVWTTLKVGLWIIVIVSILSIVGCVISTVTNPLNQAARVVNKTIDADNMLNNYRWFHDASASLDLYPTKIQHAKELETWAEAHAPERAMARQTELTGLEQTCLGLVGDYNSRAARLDSGFFRNPERWLPVSTEAWAPLPPSYSSTWCDEKETSK